MNCCKFFLRAEYSSGPAFVRTNTRKKEELKKERTKERKKKSKETQENTKRTCTDDECAYDAYHTQNLMVIGMYFSLTSFSCGEKKKWTEMMNVRITYHA